LSSHKQASIRDDLVARAFSGFGESSTSEALADGHGRSARWGKLVQNSSASQFRDGVPSFSAHDGHSHSLAFSCRGETVDQPQYPAERAGSRR